MPTRAPFAGMRRVIIPIDGGYFQKNLNDTFHDESIDYTKLAGHLTSAAYDMNLFTDLIRVYYYDAIAEIQSRTRRLV